jgi:hypothetical protein
MKYQAEEREKVKELLASGPMVRRTLAYRAGVTEHMVHHMVDEGVLEVCGQEPRNQLHGPQRGRGNPIVRLKGGTHGQIAKDDQRRSQHPDRRARTLDV